MPNYCVKWSIDVFDVESPRVAAKKALEIHRDPESIATVFVVETHESDEITLIDLNLNTEDPGMKPLTIADMITAGASKREAEEAMELFNLLKPGMKIKRNGRVDTSIGDKTPLGLYRTLKAEILRG